MADYDFIKLTFDGVTTTELGLYVVNDGNRYNTPLTPTFENRTTSIPGRPGLLYWGTDLMQQEFPISLATDGMTGVQLNNFRRTFQPGKIGKLSFEESFYKYYNAMISAPPSFSFIPFDKNGETIYKGEIELQMTTLFPYAVSDLYVGTAYVDRASYKESGLPLLTHFPAAGDAIYHLATGQRIKNRASTIDRTSNTPILIYHAGNAPANVNLTFEETYTLARESGATPPKVVGWSNVTIGGKAILIKPRFLADIEYALSLVYLHINLDWVAQKTNIMDTLREELDGPARETILTLVNAAVANGFLALYNAFVAAFFTGYTYVYSINGIINQCQLVVKKGTVITYKEDNNGSFNGQFIKLASSSGLPTLGVQSFAITRSLSNIEVFFQNTYI